MLKYLIVIPQVFLVLAGTTLFAQPASEYLYKGIAAVNKEDYTAAMEYFSALTLKGSPEPLHYIKYGEACCLAGLYDKAIESFQKADEQKPGIADLYLAKCYAQNQDFAKAQQYLKKYLANGMKKLYYELYHDPAFFRFRSSAEWKAAFTPRPYSSDEQALNEALTLINNDNAVEALGITDEILSRRERYFKAFRIKAMAFERLSKYAEASDTYSELIALRGREPDYYNQRAACYEKTGKYQKAAHDYIKSLELDSFQLHLYLKLGNAAWKSKDAAIAKRSVEKYLKYYEKDEEALHLMGNILYKSEAYIDALYIQSELIEINPGKEEYFTSRGQTYMAANKPEFAARDFSMALDLNPRNADTYFNRGLAWLESGKIQAACNDWNRADNLKHPDAVSYIRKYCSKF